MVFNTQAAIKPPPGRLRIRRLILRVLLAYGVLIIAMMLLENRLIFHPSGPGNWRDSPDPRTQDVFLDSVNGDKIHGWYLPRDGAKSVFLYAHGNAGNLSHRGYDAVVWSNELNVAVLMYDYPGFGKSTGSPTEAGCYAAADAMWNWLIQEKKYEPKNVLPFGKSLGSAMAVD